MKVLRFSAIENFGVPLDNPEEVSDIEQLIGLMEAYSIVPQDVSTGMDDETPYYWKNPEFKYFLSRDKEDGPVVIDLMPRKKDSATYLADIDADDPNYLVGLELPLRTIEIPASVPAFAIAGPGPRFAGQLCVHELIAKI
jgi:hypothetical protein